VVVYGPMGLKISKGSIVRLEYELKAKGGDVIESSASSGPIRYVQGDGKMLPALEARVEGMGVAEEKSGIIPSSEAFPEDKLPVTEMLRKEFPAGENLEIGRMFEAKNANGQPISFKVLKVDDEKVHVKLFPPLAGKDLEFRVKVLGIDDPKAGKREGIAPPPPPADALGIEEDK
jgi:FKBP-type peptidyl-prolyl cis-trans isomerase 2